jgi:hypothetical protein
MVAVLSTACFEDSDPVEVDATTEGSSDTGTTGVNTTAPITASGDGEDDGPDPGPTSTTAAGTTSGTAGGETGDGPCPSSESGFCTEDGQTAYGVFATSTPFDANLGGLTGADQLCNSLAENAGLPGEWMAWLSDGQVSAGNRIPGRSEPYVLLDGTVVVETFSDFLEFESGNFDREYLLHPIDLSELGEDPGRGTARPDFPADIPVWTGTFAGGDSTQVDQCDGWTSNAADMSGSVGSGSQVDSFWSWMFDVVLCSSTASLYCMQVE